MEEKNVYHALPFSPRGVKRYRSYAAALSP